MTGVATGFAFALFAFTLWWSKRVAHESSDDNRGKDLSDLTSAVATALLSGVAITLGVWAVQQRLGAEREREQRILMATDLSGFDFGPREDRSSSRGSIVKGRGCVEPRPKAVARDEFVRWIFASKRLNGADFSGLNLTGAVFRDAVLENAHFECAILDGVDFTGADLSGADLRGRSLDNVQLLSATLQGTELWGNTDRWGPSVTVNARTCWPAKILDGPEMREHLNPRPINLDLGYDSAYGHVCGTKYVHVPDSLTPVSDPAVPAAPGEDVDSSAVPDDDLVALREALEGQQTAIADLARSIDELGSRLEATQASVSTGPSPTATVVPSP